MVTLTKIDNSLITINADEIETIETAHDSRICLKSGKFFIVKESYHEIVQLVVDYKRQCFKHLLDLKQFDNS